MMTLSTANLLEECRSKGFNPHQLSCSTCNLLKDMVHFENCQYCCQAYKDTKNTAIRYGAAVLLHSPGGSDEMDNFVKDDLPTMDKREQIIVKEQQQKDDVDLRMMMMGFMGSKPSSILWLEAKPKSSIVTVDALKKIAKEEIDLRGWKRDDIKSMLQTLLA